MNSDYVRKVHIALQERKESTLMVKKFILTDEDISLLKQLEEIYDKKVILGSSQEVYEALTKKDKDVFVVD